MPAIKVTQEYFGSSARLYGPNGLGAVIRGLAIDHARIKLQLAAVPDLVDNTTGVAGTKVVDVPIPSAAFNATSVNGTQLTAFNASLVKFENAGKVLVNSISNARTRLGLAAITAATGTQVTADTIPAQDKTATAGTGTAAVDYVTGRAAMLKAKQNLQRLVWAANEVLVAVGATPIPTSLLVATSGANLVALTAATASATGASSISLAAGTAFLDAIANDLAQLASKWNAAMTQTAPVTLNVVAG